MFLSPERGRCWAALTLVVERNTPAPPPCLLAAVGAELDREGDAPGVSALRELAALLPRVANLNGPYVAHRVAEAYKRRVWRRRIRNADRYDWGYDWREVQAEAHRRSGVKAEDAARQCAAEADRRDLVPIIRADAERHAAEAERLEHDVAAARAQRLLVHRRWRIAGRIAAGFVAVLLVSTFAVCWLTDLRDVLSYPLAATTVAGLLAGYVLISGGAQDGSRRFIVVGGLPAAGVLALLLGSMFLWRWC